MAPANELLQFAEYSPADGTNTAFEIAGLRHVLLVHSQKQNGFCCARIRLLEHHGVEAQQLGVAPIGFGARSKPAQCACQLGGWNGRRSRRVNFRRRADLMDWFFDFSILRDRCPFDSRTFDADAGRTKGSRTLRSSTIRTRPRSWPPKAVIASC
jgi:hypothetical protein